MAYSLDHEILNIIVTAVMEGAGLITYVVFYTSLGQYNMSPVEAGGSGVWNPSLPKAVSGETVDVEVFIDNTSSFDDTLFSGFYATEVTSGNPITPGQGVYDAIGYYIVENFVPAGSGWTPGNWTFLMPADNISVNLAAGHVEI